MVVSEAAKTNWERLGQDVSQKLKRGANKTRSGKRIYPKEYITSSRTIPFLEKLLPICDADKISAVEVIYSLAVKMLKKKGILDADHVQKTLAPYLCQADERICGAELPDGEADILGIVYQSLLPEGEKNTLGSYYTPFHIISGMFENIDAGDKLFLDPCCGSGAFLLSLPARDPEKLWGCDCDPVAVMIAKVNLLCKYADSVFIPNIFCCDYLAEKSVPPAAAALFRKKFDIIATNPPWGAKGEHKLRGRGDSFFRFFVKSYSQLRDGGRIIFLFPEAVLNIRSHAEVRKMLLTETCLKSITVFEENFSGVMTGYVAVDAGKSAPAGSFSVRKGEVVLEKEIRDIRENDMYVISLNDEEDERISDTISRAGKYDLSRSIFALGIVTGCNKEKIFSDPLPGSEPIFTGKEVGRYVLKKARNHIFYRRENFQQAAKDEYYRAPEKLIYRFIAGQMVFAYDDSRGLCLNSANILIPQIPGYSIKTVLAFLNSELMRYCYMQSFKDIKILKSNLCRLPFPEISPQIDEQIRKIVDNILQGDFREEALLQKMIFDCYKLTDEQISHIRNRCK